MALSLFAAPATEPVSLEEAKDHLRVTIGDDDALIDNLIVAAREHVETYTQRALITQTWDLKLETFCDPAYFDGASVWLPKPPVSSITSITYVDLNGDSQTWSTDDWDSDLPSGPKATKGRIYPVYGESYPSIRVQPNAVTIRFVCGYGTAGEVPASLKAGMLLLIGSWYQHREQVMVSQFAGQFLELPGGYQALVTPFKAW